MTIIIWCGNVKLTKEDLWTVIVDAVPSDETQLAAWNKKDAKACAHIEYHQKLTLSNKVRLLRRLCRMILPGGNMQTLFSAIFTYFWSTSMLTCSQISTQKVERYS
ncbi:hypothetical protein PV327_010154 [Microctonus hyperodae]|uniref:Uncharacterized protein n=1 Tax=Microctonus hyperodae TaxID=165561 RepID=A0AA39FRA2_MICHY|nr:hypothetical protein PV327_010154 [Microctonus hyperodae]